MRIARFIPIGALFFLGCRSFLEADLGPAGGTGPHPKFGFVTEEKEGRLWVFRYGTKELADYKAKGEPAKFVTKIGIGPGGKTIKSPDVGTIYDYLYGRIGFTTWLDKDGRLWVFRLYAPELAEFSKRQADLAKHVTRIGAGPGGKTLKAPDAATIDDYLRAKDHP